MRKLASLELRCLLTDTLPYEVPVIFSNDKWHASLSVPAPQKIGAPFMKLQGRGRYTVPYGYSIVKDVGRSTALSIIHPSVQLEIARFYEVHHGSMLSHCADERFSLRRPVALASPFVGKTADDGAGRLKLGIVQLLADENEPDVSRLNSYFTYGKYNLLGKFIASREYIRLESRFRLCRSMDISKCFYNIYTHSITWAVKDKPIAKAHVGAYTFEARFDKLMQISNYNETNGIVVGPEFSRIFAEIILQRVDDNLRTQLKSKHEMVAGVDYDIRRYVDDYFIFANSQEALNRIEGCLRHHLEAYKLYINERKVQTFKRPFVSPLSLARQDTASILRSISRLLSDARAAEDDDHLQRDFKHLKSLLRDIRLVVARHDISFSNLSGWLLSRIRKVVRQCLSGMVGEASETRRALLGDIAISALEQAFYVCSMDLRVRTTYSMCQLALVVQQAKDRFSPEQWDLSNHVIMEHCGSILKSARDADSKDYATGDNIEIFNLLICGAHFVGKEFLRSKVATEILGSFAAQDRLTYFTYITLKFCYLKDEAQYTGELSALNKAAFQRILAPGVDVMRDTEEYLFLHDILSAPDVPATQKRDLFNKVFKGQVAPIGKDDASELGKRLGFVDWHGLAVEHLLRRKELRPVYAWG